MVKVARMYHEGGRKQADIANELHITQARVSRLLRRAVDSGVVQTVVACPAGVHTDMEDRIQKKYGITEAVVVDALSSDERDIEQNLGAAAATYLESTLLGGETIGISSWSANLIATASRMRPSPKPIAEAVVQLVGGIGDPRVQVEANRLLTSIAAATGATPFFLPAPGLLASAEAKHSLLADPAVAQISALWSKLTTVIVGIGALDPSPLLRRSGNAIAEADQDALRRLGAVGDVCYRYFDAAGRPVRFGLDERIVGIDPDQLRKVPRRIGIAGGVRKLAALNGALVGGWVNVLITDTTAAQQLIFDGSLAADTDQDELVVSDF